MKKWLVLTLVLCVFLVAGCGGGSPTAPGAGSGSTPAPAAAVKNYEGAWINTITTQMVVAMDVKKNGGDYMVTLWPKASEGRVQKVGQNFEAKKKSNETLSVTMMGTNLVLVYDPKSDTMTFDGGQYKRQTPDDVKKLEERKK